MSAPLSPFAKLKVAVPIAYMFAIFIFFVTAIFLVDGSVPRVIGAIVTFIASIMWVIARIQLGDAPTEGRLVTTGLYGEFRHPIYLFSTLSFLGVAIFMWIPFLFAPVTAIAVFQIVRARYEEKQLAEKMGRRYLRYSQRTIL